MGLQVVVGILDDNLFEMDPEGFAHGQEGLAGLNRFLVRSGYPAHEEPRVSTSWGCDLPGYYGLHRLRRLAAHLQYRGSLPERPGGVEANGDPLLTRYYDEKPLHPKGQAWLGFRRKPPERRRFDHLVLHSDCEGYYLPRDFEAVLVPQDQDDVPGREIGSAWQLRAELQALRQALGVPEIVGIESEEWIEILNGTRSSELWQHFGTESFVCEALLEACKRSLETGAAIVFC